MDILPRSKRKERERIELQTEKVVLRKRRSWHGCFMRWNRKYKS